MYEARVVASAFEPVVTMKKLDPGQIDALKARIEELPARHNSTPYQVVVQLTETILSARSRGNEIDEVVTLLASSGVRLSRNTLRNYLSRARKERAQLESQSARHVAPHPAIRTADDAQKTRSRKMIEAPVDAPEVLAVQPEIVTQSQASPSSVVTTARARAAELRQQREENSSPPTRGGFVLVPDSDDI